MANLMIEFYSNCLCRPVQFKMIIPNDFNTKWPPEQKRAGKPMKTLFLLHGYTGAAGNWVPEYLTTLYNFAIVMPNGENGFWVDGLSTGHAYGTFLTKELVEYVRRTFGLAMTAEDTYIMGLSMGGFGTLRAALACPDTFSKAVALSPAMIIHSAAHMAEDDPDAMANMAYYRECFGELETVEQSRHNPEVLVDELLKNGTPLPEMYIATGTEDFLLERIREFHNFLESRKVKHHYYESKGGHDMVFWDEYARKLVPELFGEE